MPRTLRRWVLWPTLTLLVALGGLAYVFSGPAAPNAAAAPSAAASAEADEQPPANELWPGTGAWAHRQMQQMTLEEKVSQLFAAYTRDRFTSAEDPSYERLVDRVERFGVGGVLFFQSETAAQATLLNDLQQRADVPLLIAQDMEHGAGMRVDGATTFPRPMALGATRDPALTYAAGYVTAREARALGTHHVLAPVADVNNNPDNPIINVRSFGEDPALVSEMVVASVRGLQDGGVLATAKHFPGHGDTNINSHLDLPLLPFTRERLDDVELVPFRAALAAGVKSVMTGHLSFPQMEPDPTVPATLSPKVARRLLREDMRFDGLVVTDALNMGGVTQHFAPGEAAVRALEAGTDIILMSEDPYAARTAVLRAIAEGRLSEARIDASVERLLRAKEWLRLDRARTVDLDAMRQNVGTRPHRVLSEAVARRSLTLLRNEGGLLPLTPEATAAPRRVLSIALSDDADPQAGRFFHRRLAEHLPGARIERHVLDGRSRRADYRAAARAAADADLILVPAFLNVSAWRGRIDLSDRHRALLERLLDSDKPVVLVAFGNPYLAKNLRRQPDAYLAAYGAAEASQEAVAQALVGKTGFSGKLPVTVPGAYERGAGLTQPAVAPRVDEPEAVGMSSARLAALDSLMRVSIGQRAFPGAAVAVGRAGVVARQRGYGHHTYAQEQRVTARSVFDVASLTKVLATTTAAMQLVEDGRLALDDRVARHLPAFAQRGKAAVTIQQILTHSAGLAPFEPFAQQGVTTRQAVVDSVMAAPLQYAPGTRSEYSDLGFIALGLVIEAITGQPLNEYAAEHIFAPLGMTNTDFRSVGMTDARVVPTERDRTFRRRLVQGEVHDEAAFILGGTAGHAGLFSTAEDLATFAYMLAHGGRIYGKQFLKEETIRRFTQRAGVPGSARGLGWDTKSAEGYSSAGPRFGPLSFGHTGFTGTSLWIDPDHQLFVILLTNRVYPDRSNRAIVQIRPQAASLAHRALVGPPEPLLPRPRVAVPALQPMPLWNIIQRIP